MQTPTTLTVKIPLEPERSYAVRIGNGVLAEALAEVETLLPGRRPFLVTDAAVVAAGHAEALTGERKVDSFVIDPPGEPSKTLRTVEAIVAEMERGKFGRDSLIIALGGGTVGDIGAFAAAIFKRGVPVVQIPTTTVSQADSSIGGKAGVDSGLSKNAYGAFHHPAMVIVDVSTLTTLDERHYRAGLVESVKHGLIADADYFNYIESNLDAILARDATALMHLAERNCAIKGRVVFEDPREKNLRRILNFGHTLGHAVEAVSEFSLLHGESVAVGIVAACRIAERMNICSSEVGQRARRVLEKLGQPLSIPATLSMDQIKDAMARDKKSIGSSPRFVLLEDLGAVHASKGSYAMEIPGDVLADVLNELIA